MIGSRPCAYACAYVDPVFTSQSYDICTSTKTSNLSVFLVLTLMLMSTQFSLAYTCACVTIVFFAAVNHNYDHKKGTLKLRNTQNGSVKSTKHRSQTMTFCTRLSKVLYHKRSAKIIDGSE